MYARVLEDEAEALSGEEWAIQRRWEPWQEDHKTTWLVGRMKPALACQTRNGFLMLREIHAIRCFYVLIWTGLTSCPLNYLERIFSCCELAIQIMETANRRRRVSHHEEHEEWNRGWTL